jgi:hypothetical protein
MKTNAISVIIGLLVFGCATLEPRPKSIAFEITWFGIYKSVSYERFQSDTSPTGYRPQGSVWDLIANTDHIPAALGTSFGFRAIPIGLDEGESLVITRVVHYPPGGITNPYTGRRHFSTTAEISATGGVTNMTGYNFTEPFELVPGKWRFEYWHGQRLILEKAFNVYIPR